MQLRTRGEYRDGRWSSGDGSTDPAAFINERARLSLRYSRDDLSFKFSAQHVGVWGQDPLVDKIGRLAVNEAWARIGRCGWFVQAGRQGLVYDDMWMMGTSDYNVAGWWHDALIIGHEKGRHSLHAIFTFNQNGENIAGSYYDNANTAHYKCLQSLWYHWENPTFAGSLQFINMGQEAGTEETPKTEWLQTLGGYFKYEPSPFSIIGSMAWQFGRNPEGQSVSAWMCSIKTTWNITRVWSVNLCEVFLSGDGRGGKYGAYDPLYGYVRTFWSKLFYNSAFQAGCAPGLSDSQAGLSCKASELLTASILYHYFFMGAKIEGLERHLGHELDFRFSLKIQKDVTLALGHTMMRGSSSLSVLKGIDRDCWLNWSYVSLNVNPSLLFRF